jgi:hypothetical protein
LDIGQNATSVNSDGEIAAIDFPDAIHPRQGQQYLFAAVVRDGTATQSGIASLRNNCNTRRGARSYDCRHFRGGARREHDQCATVDSAAALR